MPLVRFRVAGFDEHTTAPEVYDALAKQLALEDVSIDKDSFQSTGGGGKQCEFELPDDEAELLRGPYACCKVGIRGITELQFKEIGPSKGRKAGNAQSNGNAGVGIDKARSEGKAASGGKKNAASKTSQESKPRLGRPDYRDPNSDDSVVFPKPKQNPPPKLQGSNVANLGGMDFTLDSTKVIACAPTSQHQPAGGMSFPAPRKAPRRGNDSSDSDDDGYLRAPEPQAAAWERRDVSEAAKAPPSWGPPTSMPPTGAASSAAAAGFGGVAGSRNARDGGVAAGGEDAPDSQAPPSKTDGVPKTERACTIDYCAIQ